ncbi:MAG: hypothetical protein LBI48_11525 [Burkholderiaceae bacterium]|nr:hypothetical protein [Burkholderiaceae bacterium]
MVDKLIASIPAPKARQLVASAVLIGCALVLAAAGFGIGWTLRHVEDEQDMEHERAVAVHASQATEEQMVRDLKLLLSCQQVAAPPLADKPAGQAKP